ncbi:MAG: hypothetical protein FWE09_01635 [Treponema sp.]|nr:hypothetical protein [Treponema sp.]
MMEKIDGRLYEPAPGFEGHLRAELPGAAGMGHLIHDTRLTPEVFWHRNCWLEPFRLKFSSIGEAASALRGIQRNWAPSPRAFFRRGALIASKLPSIRAKPRAFPWSAPEAPMGAWTLIGEGEMIASARCSSPFPAGAIEFKQDKEGPPSRAYLKLWEALARLRTWPEPGARCLDVGASPGGWTWALARLGAQVLSIDRAPLDERIAAMPGVTFQRGDAFALGPQDIGRVDWLFCDAACYPAKLYGWIQKWLESGLCKNFVCTIKMQGTVGTPNASDVDCIRRVHTQPFRAGYVPSENHLTQTTYPATHGGVVDFETPKLFARIPGSAVAHMHHNKHELTWMLCA